MSMSDQKDPSENLRTLIKAAAVKKRLECETSPRSIDWGDIKYLFKFLSQL